MSAPSIDRDRLLKLRLVAARFGEMDLAKVVRVFRMLFVKEKAALKAALERWAALPGLMRIIPCHGTIVSHNAPAALRTAADTL